MATEVNSMMVLETSAGLGLVLVLVISVAAGGEATEDKTRKGLKRRRRFNVRAAALWGLNWGNEIAVDSGRVCDWCL